MFYKATLSLLFLTELLSSLQAQPQLYAGAAPFSVRNVIAARWRGFNNAGGGNAALYLGNSNIGAGGINRVQYAAAGMYIRPGNNSISFSYNAGGDNLTASINGNTIIYNNVSTLILGGASMCRMNYMNILMRNSATGTVTVTNWNLNGTLFTPINIPGGSNQQWHIRNFDFSKGFVLTGTLVFNAGAYAGSESAKVEMTVGEMSPVTSTSVSAFCNGGNPTVTFDGLLPNSDYTVNYTLDGSPFSSPLFTSNNVGTGSFDLGPLTNLDFGRIFLANTFSVSGGCNWTDVVNNSFTLIENAPCILLPVRELNVNAYRRNEKIIIDWQTLNETNTIYFDIESSQDGRTWKKIGQLPAKGNSNSPSKYQYTLTAASALENYFRIRVVDQDNKFSYSKTIKVDAPTVIDIVLSPNPVTDILTVSVPFSSKITRLSIVGSDGMLVFETSRPGFKTVINMDRFISGIYFVKIVLENGDVQVKRVIRK